MNSAATFLMFNSASEKLLTHAFCQLPFAFITFLSPFWDKVWCCCLLKVWPFQKSMISTVNGYLLQSCYIDLCKSAHVLPWEQILETDLSSVLSCKRWKVQWNPAKICFPGIIFKRSILRLSDSVNICLKTCGCAACEAAAVETQLMYRYCSAWVGWRPRGNLCHAAATSHG